MKQHLDRLKGMAGALAFLALAACSHNETPLSAGDEPVSVTFLPALCDGLPTRAMGDATGIDQLTVAVYEGSETLSQAFTVSEQWETVQKEGITLTLVEGRPYQILFWATDKDCTAYTLTKDGTVSVDYSDYTEEGFARMEEMDAFYATSYIEAGKIPARPTQIELTRPFAKLNFADNSTASLQGVRRAVVTFHSYPTAFRPFTGEVVLTEATRAEDEVTFSFTDFPDEPLTVEGETYHYVSGNYLFAPAGGTTTVAATFELQQVADGTVINRLEFRDENALLLEQNKKTNVVGTLNNNG